MLGWSDYLVRACAAGFGQVGGLPSDYADITEADLDDAQLVAGNAEGRAMIARGAKTLVQQSDLSSRDLARKVASAKVKACKPA